MGSSCPCSDSSSSSRSRSNAVFGAPAIEISLSLPPPLLRIVDDSLLGESENPDVNIFCRNQNNEAVPTDHHATWLLQLLD